MTTGDGPIRSCAIGSAGGCPLSYRLTTIEEPALTIALHGLGRGRGDDFSGPTT